MRTDTRILVSGASIAGCCLAFWLRRFGRTIDRLGQSASEATVRFDDGFERPSYREHER